MKITKQQLEIAETCQDGIDFFTDLFGNEFDFGEWTPYHQAMMLGHSEARRYWGWCVLEGVIPSWSMSAWDLRGADLRGANLRYTNFQDVDFRGANLQDVDFQGCESAGC